MPVIDQTKIVEKYKGKWVILDKTRTKVLASDIKLKKAIDKFHKKYGDTQIASTFKVPSEILPHIGNR